MIQARFVPIDRWPGKPTTGRKISPFSIKFSKNLDDLESELKHLGAGDIVVQAFLSRDDIRNDGWPRSDARFFEPGVILSFRTKTGEDISFPCDTYRHWECNLRAICLTLTALRAIDRYGVTKRQEQYAGWKKLPAPANEQRKDAEWAWTYLAALNDVEPQVLRGISAIALDEAYRRAARRAHPDSGGNHEAFTLLQEAMEILRKAA